MPINLEVAKKYRSPAVFKEYSEHHGVLFALACNASAKTHLSLLYEEHRDFQISPIFLVALGMQSFSLDKTPGVECDLDDLLHLDQYLEVIDEIPKSTTLRQDVRIVDVLDKKNAAVIIRNIESYDDKTNKKLAYMQFAIYQKNGGGFGGNPTSPVEIPLERINKKLEIDKVFEIQTSVNQAAIFRQCNGCKFPLHIDPTVAKEKGFPDPLLHGICTLGISVQAIIDHYAKGDWRMLKSLKCRFSAPVYPGDQLEVKVYRDEGKLRFETMNLTTNRTAISSAYVVLKESHKL
ncbi:unnamed protein product [Bursaphelenchus xylophilus]|uniref:(pine wood nematode) hypothetical protein n=1 Tax=Bursaphelenchus xylophilus TaxID=6326 RepID=A0A1I7RTX4_BURXY|nr:unnamed protein product [Bursaphelenchus xylophilus]CAG9132121.1 unnamed protein product [Bursaphelenchus xylophilus]